MAGARPRPLRRLADRLARRGPALQVLGGTLVRFDRVLQDPSELPILWRRATAIWRLGGWRELLRLLRRTQRTEAPEDYAAWVRRYDRMSAAGERRLRRRLRRLGAGPRILVLLEPGPPELLAAAQADLARQLYAGWTAAEAGTPLPPGDFVLRLAPQDRLPPYALAAFVLALAAKPGLRLLYADHDRLDAAGGRCAPVFKPDWNATLLLAGDYLGPPLLVERGLASSLSYLVPTLDATQRHGFLLRVSRALRPDEIEHLPQVLLHLAPEGAHRGGVLAGAPGEEPAAAALAAWLAADGRAAQVTPNPLGPGLSVRWKLPDPPPRVTVIVPTRDRLELLQPCLRSLLAVTGYPDLELLVVDNDSREPATLAFLSELARDPRVRVLRDSRAFNFAALNNAAAAEARGELLCLLNNDIEVLEPGWLGEMVGWALQPGVGLVGARLLYPGGDLQHAGVVLGLGDAAGHLYRGQPAALAPPRARVAQELSAVTAACLLIGRSLYQELGGLDAARFAVAYNDVDLCLRVTARGLAVVWTPQATLLHRESQSRGLPDTAERLALHLTEVRAFRRRWLARLQADPHYNPNLTVNDESGGLAWPPRLRRPWL